MPGRMSETFSKSDASRLGGAKAGSQGDGAGQRVAVDVDPLEVDVHSSTASGHTFVHVAHRA